MFCDALFIAPSLIYDDLVVYSDIIVFVDIVVNINLCSLKLIVYLHESI